MKELGKLGLLGIFVPEEYGGSGFGYAEYVTAISELGKIDPSIALSVAAHNSLCTGHMYLSRQRGAEAQVPCRARNGRMDRCMGPPRAQHGQ